MSGGERESKGEGERLRRGERRGWGIIESLPIVR
jgi:hypothetical protein